MFINCLHIHKAKKRKKKRKKKACGSNSSLVQVHAWALASNNGKIFQMSSFSVIENVLSLYALIAHTDTCHVMSHTPPSLFSLHLSFILATTEGGRGRERTRGNKKEEERGQGVSVYKTHPPPPPLSTTLCSFFLSSIAQTLSLFQTGNISDDCF